ncbi:hypothetical protein JHK84_036715 [Glycine max]|nr:hypothetical protein JHK85_037036 [Glycine max]KAG5130318.1 hypothetical protein JHK84_036715 [Glycine max]
MHVAVLSLFATKTVEREIERGKETWDPKLSVLPKPSSNPPSLPTPSTPLLSLEPHRPRDPSNTVALRHAAIVWFCNDLGLLDNDGLTAANKEALVVLPVYCFDKINPYHVAFLIDSVFNLRCNF